MEVALAQAVGSAAVEQHRRRAEQAAGGDQIAHPVGAQVGGLGQQDGGRQGEGVAAAQVERIDHAHADHDRAEQGRAQTGIRFSRHGGPVAREAGSDPGLLGRRKPGRPRPACRAGSAGRRRSAPRPAGPRPGTATATRPGPGGPCRPSSAPGHAPHDHVAERIGDVEAADRPAAPGGRKPVHQVVDRAGKEPGLGGAQQEAHDVELHRRRTNIMPIASEAPGEHDPRDPAPRARPGPGPGWRAPRTGRRPGRTGRRRGHRPWR